MNSLIFKPTLYGNGCTKCEEAKKILVSKNIEVNYITDMKTIISIGTANNLTSLPILEYAPGVYLCSSEAVNHIKRSYNT